MKFKPDPILVDTVRSRIRMKMDELGISQAQLADAAGVTRSGLNELLKKERLPGCDFLIKVAERLGVSIDYLVGRGFLPEVEGLLYDTSTQRLLTAFAALDPDKRERLIEMIEELNKVDGSIDNTVYSAAQRSAEQH